VGESGRVGHS